MARKLTIRRVGSFLPALSLVVVLLLCMTIGWLSAVGLPQDALRYIEKELAAQNIHLRLRALKLEPSRGLAFRAEGISLLPDATATQPLLTADSVSVGINASRLLATGVLGVDTLHLRNGAVYLPTLQADNTPLTIDKIDMAARISRRNIARLTTAGLRVQGVGVRMRGSCDLNALIKNNTDDEPQATPPEQAPWANLESLLREHAAVFDTIYCAITSQHWSNDELPTLELELFTAADSPYISANLSVPKYDWKQFHFRHTTADISFKDDTVTIHTLRFHTTDPDSTAVFQGGFSIPEKALSFSLESNVDLLNMLQPFMAADAAELMQKFSYPEGKAPSIKLRGDVVFAENGVPDQARVHGNFSVAELSVGSERIDQLELSFLYHNGDFNIDKLALTLPGGSANLTAAAQHGEGEADVRADLQVPQLLRLINQLAPRPITLPQDLQLHSNIRIEAQAKLTTLPLTASREEWEGFVPSISHVRLKLSTDQITYRGYTLVRPDIRLRIGNIVQGHHKIPESLESAELDIAVAEITCADSTGMPCRLQELAMHLDGADISFAANEPYVEQMGFRATLKHAEGATWSADSISVPSVQIAGFAPLAELHTMFRSAELAAHADSMTHAHTQLGAADVHCKLSPPGSGSFRLSLKNEQGAELLLSAMPDWSTPGKLVVSQVDARLPMADFAPLLEHIGISTAAVEFPALLTARGNCTWDMAASSLETAHVCLDIPEIIRTPYKQVPFRGKRIPIAVKADAQLRSAAHGGIDYEADLHVTHQTGEFRGKVAGNTAAHLRVTGNNSIRADIIDQLIDSEDAHAIIRDFRFNPRSRTIVTNIDTKVNYANGITVDSYCDARIENAEYMMSVLEVQPDKTERMRTDLSRNPYTYVTQATCGVVVDVRMDRTNAQGKKLKDTICITLTNPKLTYDNEPWLRRCGFKTGTPITHLGGEAVIIDVENSFVELRNVSGTVYPAYSIGMFYADIQHFMEDIVLPHPAQVETAGCVFPIYSDCKRPMSGTIRALADKGAAFNFLGTSIPLSDFSGFIYLTDDYVQLDKLNAKSWGGVLDAVVRIGFRGKHTSFDGEVWASNMNLQRIAAAYDSEQAYALCNGNIRFYSPSPAINDIRAYGQVDITNGDLLTLSLFRPVGSFIADLPSNLTKLESLATKTGVTEKPGIFTRMMTGILSAFQRTADRMGDGVDKIVYYVPGANHLLSYDLQEAFARFNIADGRLTSTSMKAKGHNLNVQMNMAVDLNSMVIHGNIWPKVSSLPTIILSPLTFLSDFMVDIVVHGPIDDLDWHFALDRRLNNQEPSATSDTPANNPKPINR